MKKLISSIKVPKYVRCIEVSKKQRPKYWEWNGVTIKCGSKKLLQKYINPLEKENIILNNGKVLPTQLKDAYCIIGYKGNYQHSILEADGTTGTFALTEAQHMKPIKYFLCEKREDGMVTYSMIYTKVIANPKQAGEPKYRIINGQNIYNHTLDPFTLGKVFDAIKLCYYNKFKTIEPQLLNSLRQLINESYPLIIEMEILDTVKNFFDNTKEGNGKRWDVGNRADPYMKTFLDFLTMGYKDSNDKVLLQPIIEDDDRLHVSSGNNAIFTPIENEYERALIFHIYQDTREVWKQYLDK